MPELFLFDWARGAENDLLIVTSTNSGLSWVVPVEFLDFVFCMGEAFCRVSDFIMFRSVSFPLGSILELIVVESRVDDFVKFVFVFSFYINRSRGFFDLRGESVVLVWFQEGDMECVVYGH